MTPSAKKKWVRPEIRQFETPEELLAFYRKELPDEDFQTLVKLAERRERAVRRDVRRSQSANLAKK